MSHQQQDLTFSIPVQAAETVDTKYELLVLIGNICWEPQQVVTLVIV